MLKSKRVELIPVSKDYLELLLENIDKFEEATGIKVLRSALSDAFKRIVEKRLEYLKSIPSHHHLWNTYWAVVLKENREFIGILRFNGYPDKEGITDIIYLIMKKYEDENFGFEALKTIMEWAFSHDYCYKIKANRIIQNEDGRIKLTNKFGSFQMDRFLLKRMRELV